MHAIQPAHDDSALPSPCESGEKPLEALENEITELYGHISAATHRLLVLIAELDRRGDYGAWGIQSCAHWLNYRCGIGLRAAHEKVRVARALPGLAKISAAFERGELSYSKVRAMTRIGNPDNEDYLLMIAEHGTAQHVEELVRKYRSVERSEERARAGHQHESRELSWYYDDDGSVVIRARLPAEQGELVLKALEAAREAVYHETAQQVFDRRLAELTGTTDPGECSAEHSGEPAGDEAPVEPTRPFPVQHADALVAMADSFLAHGASGSSIADRYLVTVHVDQAVLEDPQAAGRCELENGPWISSDTMRRLTCDASLVRLSEDADGTPLDVGRKTRSIPPALRRALRSRDGGCRFPGCPQKLWVDGHHVEHWANGGETKLANLILLCRRHHRLVHEGGFGLSADRQGRFRFKRPTGEPLPQTPAAKTHGDCAALFHMNERRGLAIDAETCVTGWLGEKMDWSLAIDQLIDIRDRTAPERPGQVPSS